MQYLPVSRHLPSTVWHWKARERIHRSLQVIQEGWTVMFDRCPELNEHYQWLAVSYTGVLLGRDFPMEGILTPGAMTATTSRTLLRRQQRQRQKSGCMWLQGLAGSRQRASHWKVS